MEIKNYGKWVKITVHTISGSADVQYDANGTQMYAIGSSCAIHAAPKQLHMVKTVLKMGNIRHA